MTDKECAPAIAGENGNLMFSPNRPKRGCAEALFPNWDRASFALSEPIASTIALTRALYDDLQTDQK